MPIDIDNDGTLQTPLREIKRKANLQLAGFFN